MYAEEKMYRWLNIMMFYHDQYVVLVSLGSIVLSGILSLISMSEYLSIYLFILQHPLTSIMCSRAVSARIKARF